MAKDTPIRRSTRSKKPSEKFLANIAQAHVEKRRSRRLALLEKGEGMIDTPIKRRPLIQKRLSEFVVGDTDSAASSSSEDESHDGDSDFEAAPSPSPEPEERIDLTRDHFEYMAADELDRRESYDSRLEEGNEEYERDGFVVGDEESEYDGKEGTVWDSESDEVTIVGEGEEGDSVMSDSDSDSDSISIPHASPDSTPTSPGLFVSSASSTSSVSLSALFHPLNPSISPADVAEEINDAVSRFSRRCNRHSAPLRLELSAQVWADDEVSEAVERAVVLHLGQYAEVHGGSVIVTIGLPGMWVMDSYLR